MSEVRRIFCHYFLPTCGNITSFEPPISICDYVCEHIESLCPEVVDEIRIYFENNKNILAPLGLTMINCSNTGEYLPPFHQNCCTNLDIKICKFTYCVINAVVKISCSIYSSMHKGEWSGARLTLYGV